MTSVAAKMHHPFYRDAFLSTVENGRKIVTVLQKHLVFSQGDLADSVFYVQEGRVRLSVVGRNGREAIIGILNGGDFFGEACLAGQSRRMCSATAMTDCTMMRINKNSMNEVIHRERAFADMFVAYLLSRSIRYEEDLVDQLFNSSEKRLARTLLMLANFGEHGRDEVAIPRITQETLAEMVGTTRGRVNFFMNRFRRLGFVRYDEMLEIHSSLLNVVLDETARPDGRRREPHRSSAPVLP